MQKSKRIHTLDEIRGFCVMCMVFFHCFFTMGMYGGKFSAELFDFFTPIQPFFAAAFVIICGLSCHLSHSNLMRGIIVAAVSLGVTFVSLIIMPEMPIIFGILHLLSTGILLYVPLKRLLAKIPMWVGISVCVILFFATYNLSYGYLGFDGLRLDLPKDWYKGGFLTPLGFMSPGDAFSDYFPVLPWLFAFFAGTFLGRLAKDDKFPEFMYKARIPFLSMLGKNALFVYILHQPIAYGIFYLINLLGGIPK